jgi:hypothetical protein
MNCETCDKPLEQAKTGRPRKFCNEACRAKAKRRKLGLAELARRVTGRPETPSPDTPRPEEPRPREQLLARLKGSPARAAALGRAMAKVKRAEEELAAAKAVRAGLQAEPDPFDQHQFRTYRSIEELHQGGPALSSGIDSFEAAQAIRRELEGE